MHKQMSTRGIFALLVRCHFPEVKYYNFLQNQKKMRFDNKEFARVKRFLKTARHSTQMHISAEIRPNWKPCQSAFDNEQTMTERNCEDRQSLKSIAKSSEMDRKGSHASRDADGKRRHHTQRHITAPQRTSLPRGSPSTGQHLSG